MNYNYYKEDNKSNNSSAASGGVGFAGLLTIAFIVLKLTNVISWSWWWVLSPLWISAALVILIMIIIFGVLAWFYR
jgi:phosphoglycerol transferase MdoB-like AlkP superfamily enzyme